MRASVAACCASGSFPLTQGKQVSVTRHRHHRGLIPAHAGKTAAPAWTPGGRPAHPRSGGENWSLRPSHLWMWGSSPLTRGKRARRWLAGWAGGLISAHAGKTTIPSGSAHVPWAHPRSRGENASRDFWRFFDEGSSPLTRGKRRYEAIMRQQQGLILAHAGKTTACRPESRSIWAHPRSRGENDDGVSSHYLLSGSSPLTRGKPLVMPQAQPLQGLIPAHAGKTGIQIY